MKNFNYNKENENNSTLTLDEIAVHERIRTKLLNAGHIFDLKNHHTLVIGLGGTGLRFAKATKKLLYKRYDTEEVSRKVKFLFIDAARTSFADVSSAEIGKGEELFLSNKGILGFEQNGYPDYITNWLNEKVEPEILCDGNGAASVRQAGRCLLYANIEKVRSRIRNILTDFKNSQVENGIIQTNIFILSGLAGGTGSGTFIDVTFLVHKLIQGLQGLSEPRVFGIFELPDSSVRADPNPDDEVRRYRSYGNGYAALKELDYFINMRQRDGKPHYITKFGNDLEEFSFNTSMYKRVLLFSSEGMTKDGDSFPKDPIQEEGEPRPVPYLSHAIPEVINVLISKPVNEKGDEYFHIEEQFCNGTQGCYSSAGVSKLEVYKEKIILCVTVRLFYELMARWDIMPNEKDIAKIIDLIGIRALRNKIDSEMENILEDYEDDELSSSGLANRFQSDLAARVARISHQSWRQEYQSEINKIYEEKGPFYAIRLKTAVESQLHQTLMNMPSSSYNIASEHKDFKEAGKFSRKKARIALLDALEKSADINKLLISLVEARLNIMNEINNSIYNPVTKLVELFTSLLEKLTGIKVETRRSSVGNTQVFSCDLSDVPYSKINEKISGMFVKKVTFAGGTETKYVTSDIFRIKTDGTQGFPVFSKKKNPSEPESFMAVPNDPDIATKKVIAIEDKLLINGTEKDMDFDKIAAELLRNISKFIGDTSNSNNANNNDDTQDILDILIEKVKTITDQIVAWEFEDLLLMLGRGANIADGVKLDDNERKTKLEEAIKLFYKYSVPSIPLKLDKLDELGRTEKYELTVKPKTGNDFLDILNRERDTRNTGYIAEVDKSSVLLDIVLYLGIDLTVYQLLDDARKGYEWCKNPTFPAGTPKRDLWSGIHLSEGKDERYDWRTFLNNI